MKIKYAIFDFDGTLFDSMFLWDTVGEIYLRSLGKEPKTSLQEDVRTLSLYQSSCYLRQEYGLALSVEEIMNGINRTIEDFYIYEVQPKPGVITFLKELKQYGISMCIATATDRYLIEAALKRCDMGNFFDEIFTCSEVAQGKDHPLIFRKAMEYFHADRNNTVIFEDAFHAICTAKNDGFTTIAVFDESETHLEEIRNACDFYLAHFEDTKGFWKFTFSLEKGGS